MSPLSLSASLASAQGHPAPFLLDHLPVTDAGSHHTSASGEIAPLPPPPPAPGLPHVSLRKAVNSLFTCGISECIHGLRGQRKSLLDAISLIHPQARPVASFPFFIQRQMRLQVRCVMTVTWFFTTGRCRGKRCPQDPWEEIKGGRDLEGRAGGGAEGQGPEEPCSPTSVLPCLMGWVLADRVQTKSQPPRGAGSRSRAVVSIFWGVGEGGGTGGSSGSSSSEQEGRSPRSRIPGAERGFGLRLESAGGKMSTSKGGESASLHLSLPVS